jgi:hypothetical protein
MDSLRGHRLSIRINDSQCLPRIAYYDEDYCLFCLVFTPTTHFPPTNIDLLYIPIIPTEDEPFHKRANVILFTIPDSGIPSTSYTIDSGAFPSDTDNQGVELLPYFKIANLVVQTAYGCSAKCSQVQ